MRGALRVVVQVIISVLVVGAMLPMVLTVVPAARSAAAGPALVMAGIAVVFLLLRRFWRRSRRN